MELVQKFFLRIDTGTTKAGKHISLASIVDAKILKCKGLQKESVEYSEIIHEPEMHFRLSQVERYIISLTLRQRQIKDADFCFKCQSQPRA